MKHIRFIVASINQKAIRKTVGLESQMIRYTPVLCEKAEDIPVQFAKAFPDDIILMTMPGDILQKNLNYLDEMEKKIQQKNEKALQVA